MRFEDLLAWAGVAHDRDEAYAALDKIAVALGAKQETMLARSISEVGDMLASRAAELKTAAQVNVTAGSGKRVTVRGFSRVAWHWVRGHPVGYRERHWGCHGCRRAWPG